MFGSVMESMHENFPNSLEEIIEQLVGHATTDTTRRHLSDLRFLRCLRPYVCTDKTLRIEGKLGKAALPTAKISYGLAFQTIIYALAGAKLSRGICSQWYPIHFDACKQTLLNYQRTFFYQIFYRTL